MFRPGCITALVIAALASVDAVHAQVPPGGDHDAIPLVGLPFQSVPGLRELTGRLIVRPRSMAEYASIDPSLAAIREREARARLATLTAEHQAELDHYFIDVPPGMSENQLAEQLLQTGLYRWVIPDWRLFILSAHEIIPDDPWFIQQWNLRRISAPAAWHISTGSPSVTVAVVDTGVDFTHPELAPNMVLGYCSYWPERRVQTSNPPNNTVTLDAIGHGTQVAGVLGAVGSNELGMAGVAWNLKIMPIRATSRTTPWASYGDIQNGVTWAANNGAKVISVSFAGIENPPYNDLGAYVRSRNALLVWAMDNRGAMVDQEPPFYDPPVDHSNITVVSGSGLNDDRWCSFAQPGLCSSYGTMVDIAAPAYGIVTTTIGGGYGIFEGVSYATPHVAATLGLILSVAPALSISGVEQALLAAADDLGPPGEDAEFGSGRLNVRRALWNAVVRQHATGLQLAPFNPAAFSIDDLYDFVVEPMDINGDQTIDDKEVPAARAFMRRSEVADLAADRP